METIKENREFRYAYRKGVKCVTPFVVLYCVNNSDKSKIGITVSKKIGKAVVRNRIKRLIRESFRTYSDSLNETFSLVFVARSRAAGATYAQINSSVRNALIQAKIIK